GLTSPARSPRPQVWRTALHATSPGGSARGEEQRTVGPPPNSRASTGGGQNWRTAEPTDAGTGQAAQAMVDRSEPQTEIIAQNGAILPLFRQSSRNGLAASEFSAGSTETEASERTPCGFRCLRSPAAPRSVWVWQP